jgi:hypothetical protein
MELEVEAEEAPTVQLTQRHHYQNLSRPNSLLGPEKEPIKFQINLVGAPPEVEQLIEHIKDVASQFLYHWKTFPISKDSEANLLSSIWLIAVVYRSAPTHFIDELVVDHQCTRFRPSKRLECRHKQKVEE